MNLICLIFLLILINLLFKNKILKSFVAICSAIFLAFQVCSLFFVQKFIGYEFIVHFNFRDISSMLDIYGNYVIIFVGLIIVLILFFYSTPFWIKKLKQLILKGLNRLGFNRNNYNGIKWINSTRTTLLIIIALCFLMNLETGIIYNSRQLISILTTNNASFEKNLDKLGLTNYIPANNIQATPGKNIIVISLESYERGFLSNEMAELTPNLNTLKKEWNYFNLKQNFGSDWTSGSLYTFMTGLPAIFGINGNYIFQNSKTTQITNLGSILKKINYNTTFLIDDAQFAGTEDILRTFSIDHIIDKRQLKRARDKDLFETAESQILDYHKENTPFAVFISTLDTHFPDGIYDERMEEYITSKNSSYEFMVAALDYNLGRFIKSLKNKGLLENTIVYIFPDHLKMGDPSILDGTGKRGLYVLTNAKKDDLSIKDTSNFYQIDLPRVILDGANIKNNAVFLADHISGDKNRFIKDHLNILTALNKSGLERSDTLRSIEPPISKSYSEYKKDKSRFIAHAGGIIDEYKYTNSLDALNLNYQKGFRLFELDIMTTSDGKFVALHDWKLWLEITDYKGRLPVTEETFLKHKIYGKYSPLSMNQINAWFKAHPDAYLVTDKVNTPKKFADQFIDKNRLYMELFSLDALREAKESDITYPIASQNVVQDIKGNKVKILKSLGVKGIAVSRKYINSNKKFLIELKKNDIKTYVFHIHSDPMIDEVYVVKYEMDDIYGIYADDWNFN